MTNNSNTGVKKICQYCHSYIKDKDDMLQCPKCNSPYHIECWYENEGCGAYGCDYKINIEGKNYNDARSVENILVNIEFLINNNLYIDAIGDCRRILNIDSNNIEAKRLFNKAIALENTKQHLLESGESAYKQEDLIGAELYYTKALKYAGEIESDLIRTKLQIIKEKYPALLKRRRRNKIISNVIGLMIVFSLLALLYYNVFLKEQREFYSIEKDDNTTEIAQLEQQISRYEKYILKYKNGDYTDEAKSKISVLSSFIADRLLDNDWRSGLKYLQKIDSSVNQTAYKDISKRIFAKAENEYKNYMRESVNSDRKKNYGEARNNLEKCLAITELFSQNYFQKDNVKIQNAINILGKKITAALKQKEVNRELSVKREELTQLSSLKNVNSVILSLKILSDESNGYYVCRNFENNKILALKSPEYAYGYGDIINVSCYRKGNISLEYNNAVRDLPVYITLSNKLNSIYSDELTENIEKEAISQRISYLKGQINKLDSLMNLKLF
ncbi:MAG: hypothetical protein JW917_05270 [Ignavibacteria bacterium]|nr:hypothetical protein [Ignavibacteria bacterium]